MSDSDDTPPDNRTVFMGGSHPPPPAEPEPAHPGAHERRRQAGEVRPPPGSKGRGGSIPIGTLMNGIYEVRRYIDAGGMGEVYEGVNVNSPTDRVAIKVMRADLAHDTRAQQLFQREGQTLVDLSHPALVRYRLAAREPTLGVPYIVTEFVEGEQLSHVMGAHTPSVADVISLMRRLAQGLAAAHEERVYHRDLSPDNIMLPGGKLSRAKIIDFGIAKAGLTTNETIIGDAFAGKFAYVAPEQLGEHGSEIGAWTDVYSLALVAIAFASGNTPDTGATVVEAVDRRRAGVNVGKAPPELQPLLRRMLAPDPARRIRSMEAVIEGLDEVGTVRTFSPNSMLASMMAALGAVGRAIAAAARAVAGLVAGVLSSGWLQSLPRPVVYAGGASAALLLVAIVGVVFAVVSMGDKKDVVEAPQPKTASGPAPEELARQGAEGVIGSIECGWVDVTSAAMANGVISIGVRGAALNPAEAEATISQAARNAVSSEVRVEPEILQVSAAACPTLNALRARRDTQPNNALAIARSQPSFERATMQPGCIAQDSVARAVLTLDPAGLTDFTLLVVNRDGLVEQVIRDRTDTGAGRSARPTSLQQTADGKMLLSTCRPDDGPHAVVLVKGQGPFDFGKRPRTFIPGGVFGPTFAALAAQNGWTVQMEWFGVTNDQRDQLVPPGLKPTNDNLTVAEGPAQEPVHQLPESTKAEEQVNISVAEESTDPVCSRNGVSLGRTTRSACLGQIFAGRCEEGVRGKWGNWEWHVKGGKAEENPPGPFASWRPVKEFACP